MSVYIKGMEMPTEGTVIAIYKLQGKFYASVHGTELYPLIPVPNHGRCIDVDALDAGLERQDMKTGEWDVIGFSIFEIDSAPTIIPADFDKDIDVLSKKETNNG